MRFANDDSVSASHDFVGVRQRLETGDERHLLACAKLTDMPTAISITAAKIGQHPARLQTDATPEWDCANSL